MHVWCAKFDMLHAMFYIFMPCFYIYAMLIYSCHVLYVICQLDAPPYIVSSFVCDVPKSCMLYRFQYKWCVIVHVLYVKICSCHITFIVLHQDFHFCCIVFSHLYSVNTTLCYINTTNLCCIKICQQFNWYCLRESHQYCLHV